MIGLEDLSSRVRISRSANVPDDVKRTDRIYIFFSYCAFARHHEIYVACYIVREGSTLLVPLSNRAPMLYTALARRT